MGCFSLIGFQDLLEPRQVGKNSKNLADNVTATQKELINLNSTKNLFTELWVIDLE